MLKICHIGAHGARNAGDVVILDMMEKLFPNAEWSRRSDWVCDDATIRDCNSSDLVLVGGGGLFIKDTHANQVSGWRWNCPVETLAEIKKPVAIFGIGYNRFRNQDDFEPIFSKHISAVLDKSIFFGMREKEGPILMVPYLPEGLEYKVEYQPCPAMFASLYYPQEGTYTGRVIFAPAMDRAALRYGAREREIFEKINDFLKILEKDYDIVIALHIGSDRKAMQYLDFKAVDLTQANTDAILNFYSKAYLVLGMRLHSLVIPFGLHTPFIGIASHDKINRFVSDVGHECWAVDVNQPDFDEQLLTEIVLLDFDERVEKIRSAQRKQWAITENNIERIMSAL